MIYPRPLRWVGASILTVVIAVVAVVIASSSLADRTIAGPTAQAARTSSRPPTPLVATLGATRAATLVSYCWTFVEKKGGAGRGVCADGAPGHPAHTLYWRPGVAVTIDLRLSASDVQIEVARIGGFAKPTRNRIDLNARREDARGRMWTIQLSRTASRSTDLLISAHFARGDIYADLGLHRR